MENNNLPVKQQIAEAVKIGKTVQVVQLQGCFHKLSIASLLGKFTQNGGKPALLALFGVGVRDE